MIYLSQRDTNISQGGVGGLWKGKLMSIKGFKIGSIVNTLDLLVSWGGYLVLQVFFEIIQWGGTYVFKFCVFFSFFCIF